MLQVSIAAQISRVAGVQGCRRPELQVSRAAGFQECRDPALLKKLRVLVEGAHFLFIQGFIRQSLGAHRKSAKHEPSIS
jgi:hypothetical protein